MGVHAFLKNIRISLSMKNNKVVIYSILALGFLVLTFLVDWIFIIGAVILMANTKSKKKQTEKKCFGTKEWSKNSGICNRCELQEDCGKIQKRKNDS